jgi:hypothetical protein
MSNSLNKLHEEEAFLVVPSAHLTIHDLTIELPRLANPTESDLSIFKGEVKNAGAPIFSRCILRHSVKCLGRWMFLHRCGWLSAQPCFNEAKTRSARLLLPTQNR